MTTLLADIGATHVRFAHIGENGLEQPQKLKASDFPGFMAAAGFYMRQTGISVKEMLVATAAWPDAKGVYIFSNQSGWDFDPEDIRSAGYLFKRVHNDFEASSYGALAATREESRLLKSGRESRDYNRLICGPGTGLGLAFALPEREVSWRVQTTFGARMLLACHTKEQHEIAIAARSFEKSGSILEFEDLASGRGLPLLYTSVCKIFDFKEEFSRAEDILEHADSKASQETLRLFHEFLGLFIHTATLMTHSYGGIYLNGGMLDRLMEKNLFRFDILEKFIFIPLADYIDHIMKNTPVTYVSDPYLALKGLMEVHRHGC